jgi:hypothetical protein
MTFDYQHRLRAVHAVHGEVEARYPADGLRSEEYYHEAVP